MDDEDDEMQESAADEPPPPPKGRSGPLKIKLKLGPPQMTSSTSSTPGEEIPTSRPRRPARTVNRGTYHTTYYLALN